MLGLLIATTTYPYNPEDFKKCTTRWNPYLNGGTHEPDPPDRQFRRRLAMDNWKQTCDCAANSDKRGAEHEWDCYWNDPR